MGTRLDMIGIFVNDIGKMIADPEGNLIEIGSWNKGAA